MINKFAEQKLAQLKNKSIKKKQNCANETAEQKSIRLEKRREYNKCRKQKIELAIRYSSQNSNNNQALPISTRSCIATVVRPYDPDDIDTNHIEEKLLFLEKIAITHTDGNKVTSITTTSTPS